MQDEIANWNHRGVKCDTDGMFQHNRLPFVLFTAVKRGKEICLECMDVCIAPFFEYFSRSRQIGAAQIVFVTCGVENLLVFVPVAITILNTHKQRYLYLLECWVFLWCTYYVFHVLENVSGVYVCLFLNKLHIWLVLL